MHRRRRDTIGLMAVVFIATAWMVALRAQQPSSATVTGASASSSQQQRAVLNRYCISCHNQKLKTGGLALDALDVDNLGDHVVEWEKTVRKLRVRAMPPVAPGRPRPDEATYESLVSYLEKGLDREA